MAGVLRPAAGDLLVSSVPRPPLIQVAWLRLAMVALARLTPLAIDLATSLLVPVEIRSTGRSRAEQILRGYSGRRLGR